MRVLNQDIGIGERHNAIVALAVGDHDARDRVELPIGSSPRYWSYLTISTRTDSSLQNVGNVVSHLCTQGDQDGVVNIGTCLYDQRIPGSSASYQL